MTKLAPKLFERRFHDFLEIGRARLPSLAPEWTDHNAHDPGIMLMELLAWVAEAQLYSLSRLRRDERAAYASLLGVAPRGTLGASGLIWPDRADPQSPASTSSRSIVLRDTDVVSVLAEYGLAFHPRSPILWTPGRLEHLETRGADGQRVDHTATNARGGIPFLPFGAQSGSRDVLALTFAARDPAGLFGANREAAVGGLWAIGVQAAPPVGGDSELAAESKPGPSSLSATLVTDDDEFDVPIKWDSTRGFLSTGVLLLNLDQVANLPQRFTLKLRAPRGFPRPPRVLRIEPNTVPIVQGRMISAEAHGAHGEPDWGLSLIHISEPTRPY